MPAIGGQSLGVARGAIEIDTSSLRSITGVARSVAADVGRQFGAIDTAAHRLQVRFLAVSRGIGQIKGELTGLSIGAGLLVGAGLRVAGAFEEADIKLSGMTGGLENAQKLSAELRKQAQAAGLPFQDMLNMATRLLPTLEGDTKELEKWYDIVKRTAVLNAQEGVTGAAFSINEALSSGGTDLVSLVERFNISRVKLRAALAENGGDFRAALDQVLTTMGITTEVADRMGQSFNASFRVAKDAALQLLAEGFTPLLQILTPLLQGAARWLAQLRETSPALVGIGAGLTTITALGAPTLLLFNQLVEAGQKLKALGILGGLGRAGGLGLAVAGGVGLGIGATNAIGRATGNEQMANAGLDDLFLTIRKLIVNIGFTFSEVDRIIRVGLVSALRTLVNAVIGAATSLGGVVSAIGAMLPGRMGGNALSKIGGDLSAGGAGLLASSNALFDAMIASMNKRSRDTMKGFLNFMAPPTSAGAADIGGGGMASGGGGTDMGERNKVVGQWAKDVARIERDAAKARLDATRDYERSVAQTVAQYNQSALREAEDFARQRARQEANFQRQLADLQADAAKREAAWQRDLTERMSDVREESAERLADLDADYAKNRERAERDHRDRLLDAAARLDAVAVRNEQQAFARQQQDAQENYNEQRQEIQAALDERIADELESHQRRLEDARAADAERLADMQRSFEEQKALEDEERALRLERQAEDHQQQLAQMAMAQAERMQQIAEQAASEKAAIDTAFVEQLNGLGIYNQAWRDQQAKAQEESLKSFALFWRAFNAQFPGATQGPQGPLPANLGQFPTSFADFGFNGASAATRTATAGGSSRNITISENAIAVYAAPGMDERALARQVRVEMERLLMEATQ